MNNNDIIQQLDNQWQLIAYLTQENQSNNKEENRDKDKEELISHTHQLAHQNKESIEELLSAVQAITDVVEELSEDQSTTSADEETEELSGKDTKYQCTLCQSVFDGKRGLGGHLTHKHGLTGKGVTEKHMNEVKPGQEPVQKDIEIEKDSESTDNSENDSDESDSDYNCPECVKSYDSLVGLSNHLSFDDGHKSPSEYFSEGGSLVCPRCDEEYNDSQELSNHLRSNHDSTIVVECIRKAKSDDEEEPTEGVYNENGNLKARKDRKGRIEDYSKEQVEEMAYEYLQSQQIAKTQDNIEEALFDRTYDSKTSGYSKMYSVLNNSDKIKCDKDLGRINKYYTEEAMIDQAEREHIKQQVKDEIGDERWKLFIRAIKSMLPEDETSKELSFYDFSGEYMGDEEYPPIKMWRMFALPHNTLLRDALKKVASGNLEFNIIEPDGAVSGTSKYRDDSTVKGYVVEATHN